MAIFIPILIFVIALAPLSFSPKIELPSLR